MNVSRNSYTPIYIVKEETNLVKSFVINKNNECLLPPKTNSLKSFYEQCGNLEKSLLVNNVENKLNFLKKEDIAKMGSNMKLVTVLRPPSHMNHTSNVSNIIITPTISTSTIAIKRNLVPNTNIVNHRKISKTRPNLTELHGRILPKIRPKEDNFIKLNNSEKSSFEPTYNPVTKARVVYRLIPSKDIKVVNKNETVVEEKKKEIRRNSRKTEHKARIDEDLLKEQTEELTSKKTDPVITRSGRTIKTPKQMLLEETLQKPKKKNGTAISCFQCSKDFNNFYQLQKHYENHPTHLPANTHSDLFYCLLAIIKNKPEHERAKVFIQQLEHIISKIKALLPCLLKKVNEDKENICTINEDVGGLLGILPGKHNLNMDALTCAKDEDGYCTHNPSKMNFLNSDAEEFNVQENEIEDCARVNTVDKWPILNKRIWKGKQQKSKIRKIKASSDVGDTHIDLGSDLMETYNNNLNDNVNCTVSDVNVELDDSTPGVVEFSINKENISCGEVQNMKSNTHHTHFHSTHFDIRSSPIKVSQSTVFHKFQINPQKMTTEEVQVRPLTFENNTSNNNDHNNSAMLSDFDVDLDAILKEIDISNKVSESNNLQSDNTIEWTLSTVDNDMSSDNLLSKSNSVKSNTDIENYYSNNSKENLPTDAYFLSSNNSQSIINL